MKGILIDVNNQTISEVEVDLTRDETMSNDIHRLLKCDCFAIYRQFEDNHDVMFGDDNARIPLPDGTPRNKFAFAYEGRTYVGNCLIMGSDEFCEETLDVKRSPEEVQFHVQFLKIIPKQ